MKYALVTGGSKGIGKATCIQLASDHQYHILINYHSDRTGAEETKRDIEIEGGKATLLPFDVADLPSVQEAFNTFYKANPEAFIEVVVNNAGIARDGLFLWMQQEDWNRVINISLQGFFNVTRPLLEPMLLNRYGRIINIVSLSGLKGSPGQTNYAAAKGAVIAATRALAQEVAKKGVTVNAIAPGFIKTAMTVELDEKALKKTIPAGRFGKAEEVAHLVSFLASEKASYINGAVININGGLHS